MENFPLAAFLSSLEADGMILTVQDYDRLLLAFRTGGAWTIARLKNVLSALLAQDRDQQHVIARKFDLFFEVEKETCFAEFDIRRVLEDLRAIETKPRPEQRSLPTAVEPEPESPPQTAAPLLTHKVYSRWLFAAIMLVAIITGFGIWRFWSGNIIPQIMPLERALDIKPRDLDFGSQFPGSSTEKTVVLHNSGTSPLNNLAISLRPNDQDDFKLSPKLRPKLSIRILQPGEKRTLSLSFEPQSEGQFSAELKITYGYENQSDTVSMQGICAIKIPLTERTRLYPDVPYVKDIIYQPLTLVSPWKIFALISAGLLLLTVLYFLYLRRLKHGPQDRKPHWNEDAPKMFHPATIGGKPVSRLDQDSLAELADSMGYFTSGQPGARLNVPASIKATVRQGGIPTCEFYSRPQLRTLLVLEDANAEALDWNPISQELAAGMNRYGVPVIYGQFSGSPEIFRTQDGHVYHVEDLEDQRHGILLLLFTDGKSFFRPQNVFALEAIARWPMLAWMDLREPRFWDETLNLPLKYHIPVYPATRDGLIQAVRSFLTERGQFPSKERPEKFPSWKRVGVGQFPSWEGLGVGHDAYIEQLLGDALPWAQTCAMMQPMPEGLADALRREFHTTLPPEQIEYLYALPNTTHTASGLHFSDEVLKVLRRGFLNRRSEKEQQEILEFILDQIEKAKPQVEQASLAYLSWEAQRERVRLELNPEDDLQRFGELLQTPLKQSLSDSLQNYGFPDQPEKIPLRTKPKNREALQRLGQVQKNPLAIPPFLSWWHKAIANLLVVLLSLSCLTTLFALFGQGLPGIAEPLPNVEIIGLDSMPARLEIKENEGWNVYQELAELSAFANDSLPVNAKYRLTLYGGGYRTQKIFDMPPEQIAQLYIDKRDEERPCVEEFSEIGVTVQSCPEQRKTRKARKKSWKEHLGKDVPEGREMSIGVEFFEQEKAESEPLQIIAASSFSPKLLESGSVDVVYYIDSKKQQIEQALAHIQADLAPWKAHSQLLWWQKGTAAISHDNFAGFERILNLVEGTGIAWMEEWRGLFDADKTGVLTEQEIIDVLTQSQATGKGEPVVLVRGDVSPQPDQWIEPVTGMEFVRIPGGCFQMGSPESEEGRFSDEGPVHEVCLDGFWMGKYEVTQKQWQIIIGNNPSYFDGERLGKDTSNHPVEKVSWDDVQEFLKELNKKTVIPSDISGDFQLPSEAEWEYACRAGTTTPFYFGETISTDQANYNGDYVYGSGKKGIYREQTTAVGSFPPNAFGLYDMHGNVYEWNEDPWHDNYEGAPTDGSVWEKDGEINLRLLRGGSWDVNPWSVCCADRGRGGAVSRVNYVGFRVVVSSSRAFQ